MMKKSFLVLLIVAALAGVSCREKPPEVQCLYGEDIPEAELNSIVEISENMIQDLADGNYRKLYDLGSEQMKSSQTSDQFAFVIELYAKAFGKLDFPQIQEAYFMTSKAKTEQVWVPCNLGMQGVNDIYVMPSNRELAVVVYNSSTDLEQMRVIFQLEKANQQWRLRSLNLFPATIKSKLAKHYMDQAIKFRSRNQLHVAYLYYKTAILLSEMGMNVEEAATKVIVDQMSQIKVDYLPEGEVQIWSLPSGSSYRVYNMDTAYDRGSLLVQVSYMTETITDEPELRRAALEIASFLDQKFPEYRQGFDGFRVTAVPERKEELFRAWHEKVLFSDLDQTKDKDKDEKPGH